MKVHCRCRSCGHRKKLAKHPLEYRIEPRCICGARSWRRDKYRHTVEIPQMRAKTGRYKVCHSDCFHHPHRMGCEGCKLNADNRYKEFKDET